MAAEVVGGRPSPKGALGACIAQLSEIDNRLGQYGASGTESFEMGAVPPLHESVRAGSLRPDGSSTAHALDMARFAWRVDDTSAHAYLLLAKHGEPVPEHVVRPEPAEVAEQVGLPGLQGR